MFGRDQASEVVGVAHALDAVVIQSIVQRLAMIKVDLSIGTIGYVMKKSPVL